MNSFLICLFKQHRPPSLFAINIFHVCDMAKKYIWSTKTSILSLFKNKSIEIFRKASTKLTASTFFRCFFSHWVKCGPSERWLHSIDFWLYVFERASSWVSELKSFTSSSRQPKKRIRILTCWFSANIFFLHSMFLFFFLFK